MTWRGLLVEFRAVPWAELTRLGATVLLCWITWLATKCYYAREWARWAPEKARVQLEEARRRAEQERRRAEAMAGELARLRGQVAAARARLAAPAQLELVERAR